MTVRHRPHIARRFDPTGRRTYRMECTCGTCGEERASRRMAAIDQARHLEALPRVPADQQCRDPQRHGTRWWEPCPTCAGQLALFDPQ